MQTSGRISDNIKYNMTDCKYVLLDIYIYLHVI